MRWSYRVGRFFGIDVYVNITLLILLFYLVSTSYSSSGNLYEALEYLLFIVAVFGCIALHEFGHALMARFFGIGTRDITLLPIGGIARLERMPESPSQEFLIAAAGPAVNVVLASLCMIWLAVDLLLFGGQSPPAIQAGTADGPTHVPLALNLFVTNVVLVVFNLVPAFPMDGGRMFRALLACFLTYPRATRISALVGQFMAVLLAVVGIYPLGDPMLVAVAVFVWLGAWREARGVIQRAALAGVTVRQAMQSNVQTVNPFDTLNVVAQQAAGGAQRDFPVLHGDQLVGMLGRKDFSAALAERGPEKHVSEVMTRRFPITRPEELVLDMLARFQQAALYSLPVLEGEQLVGMITSEKIGDYLKASTT